MFCQKGGDELARNLHSIYVKKLLLLNEALGISGFEENHRKGFA